MTIRYVQREGAMAATPIEQSADPAIHKAGEAARRALPIQRLASNGMNISDALALHQKSIDGVAWHVAAEALGAANLARAERAHHAGQGHSAASHFEFAAACFRFGQSQFFHDTDEKIALYRKSLDAFTRAAALRAPRPEKLTIPYGNEALSGWLIRPPGAQPAPVVIVFGGADGWREEYHQGALYLVERGMGVLLLDGPGQGESRLLHNIYLTEPVEQALALVVSALLDRSLASAVGVWGNSLGGTFAARAASFDARIAACCVNSGAADPAEVLSRFPRIADRFAAMRGEKDPSNVDILCSQLRLAPGENRIACPLLVLHGGADRLFSFENVHALYQDAPAADRTMLIWDDGDHCIYNHPHEKHCEIADWFAARLTGSSAQGA